MNKLNSKIQGNDDNVPYTPFERICLTTSGNLQQLISAWTDSLVSLEILRNVQSSTTDKGEFKRNVILYTEPTPETRRSFGVAMSCVKISSVKYLEFFDKEKPGLGQFFQHFCLYPSFELEKVGRGLPLHFGDVDSEWPWIDLMPDGIHEQYIEVIDKWQGSFWRLYKLECEGIQCRISEILRCDIDVD